MSRMVRKHVYIDVRQERLLKRRARQLGVTEAELIREGIDMLASGPPALPSRSRALRELRAHWQERATIRAPQTGRNWIRDDLYEERIGALLA